MNWSDYFFEICKSVSLKSKDPSYKVGCVIVGEDNEIKSTGFNGFPSGVQDSMEFVPRRYERPEKYVWTEHAERNAIYLASRNGVSLKNCKIYVNWMPCAECARAIIQSGIREVHVFHYDPADDEKYKMYRFDVTKQMCEEADVRLVIVNR